MKVRAKEFATIKNTFKVTHIIKSTYREWVRKEWMEEKELPSNLRSTSSQRLVHDDNN